MRHEKSRPNGPATTGPGSYRHQHSTTGGESGSTGTELIHDRRGVMVGEVNGEGDARQFQKHLRHSDHFLYKFNAWAWDEITLEQAEAAGARSVLIIDDESGQWYRASIETVRNRGFRLPFDDGQIALRLSHFRTRDEAAQLALFGGAR